MLIEFVAAPHERSAKLAKRMLDTEHAGDDTTQVVDPEQGGCQDEGAAVDGGVLVVSGREPAPVFEARQVIAAEEWRSVQLEEKQNEQLLDLSRQILALTDEIHRLTVSTPESSRARPAVATRARLQLEPLGIRRTRSGASRPGSPGHREGSPPQPTA
jgi:hypothetical protein